MRKNEGRSNVKEPQAYTIRKVVVTNMSKLFQWSAPGGGYAVRIFEADKSQTRGLKKF